MLNEHEITFFLERPQIHDLIAAKKKEFVSQEAEFLQISDHDFLSLIMITPALGLTLTRGEVGLFKEIALNKMARNLSEGDHFFGKDPVANAMKFLISHYDVWEQDFLDIIKKCMMSIFDHKDLEKMPSGEKSDKPMDIFIQHLMVVPYGFVRFLTTIFMQDEDHVIKKRKVTKAEYDKFMDIMSKLEFDHYPVVQAFLKTLKIK